MSKAIDDLLKPRYKVISDYPGNVVPVGTVLEKREIVDEKCWKYDKDKYPHLFKKLEWWEERQESEMPEYVKDIFRPGMVNDIYTYKVKSHFTRDGSRIDIGIKSDPKCWVDENDFSHSYIHYEPATEAEYLNHQKQKS